MNGEILHSGIVEETGSDWLRVRIVQASACGTCKVAGHCHAAESKEKVIDVHHVAHASDYRVGMAVTVAVTAGMGARAVMLAFVVPLAILAGTVFVVSRFTDDEPLMALAGLAALVPWYVALWLMRKRLQRTLAFRVKEDDR